MEVQGLARFVHKPGPRHGPLGPLKEGPAWGGSLVRSPQPSPHISPLGVSAAPSPEEEEGSAPTAGPDVEEWMVTQVGPGVAAVPVGEETTAIPGFTVEPENKTEWELAYTPAGTLPLPGPSGLSCMSCCLPGPGCGLEMGRRRCSLPGTHDLFPQP